MYRLFYRVYFFNIVYDYMYETICSIRHVYNSCTYFEFDFGLKSLDKKCILYLYVKKNASLAF